MSNLSDIGFPVRGEQDVNDVIMKVLENVSEIPCARGSYYKFADASGASMYLQANASQELIGFNPHFEGKSLRIVSLTKAIEKESSELDGAFQAWAAPLDEGGTGEYPFVFDVPDFRVNTNLSFPRNAEIQLTAFASSEFQIFAGEQDYYDSQEAEVKFASKSFIPSGLFNPNEAEPTQPPLAFGVFTGEIKEFELKTNELTKEKFYWFLVDTLGGEIDVVADPKLASIEPRAGGYLNGQFWLSGRLLEN
jgi:hypothetical protein